MEKKYSRITKFWAMTALMGATIVWGSSFVVMKSSMDVISPTYLLAYRFTIATIGLILVFFPRIRSLSREELRCGVVLGGILFVSYLLQTYGLRYTTASKNAFITTLYVIVVPFLHWFLNHIRPKKNNLAAGVVAVVGLACISLEGDLTANLGDFLTLLCGFGFALQMVFIDRYTRHHDPIKLTVVQVGVSAVLCWCTAPFLEGRCDLSVMQSPDVIYSLLYLGIMCSMVCFVVQTISQKYLSANTSAILLSFESVFGLLFSILFLGEQMTVKLLTGCALMFASMICSEYVPRKEIKN